MAFSAGEQAGTIVALSQGVTASSRSPVFRNFGIQEVGWTNIARSNRFDLSEEREV